MKGVQECYDLSMKSPARKGWTQLLTLTLRIKETHSSLSVSSPKKVKREESVEADIVTTSTIPINKTHLIRFT